YVSFFQYYGAPRNLHSFPTRRSSDPEIALKPFTHPLPGTADTGTNVPFAPMRHALRAEQQQADAGRVDRVAHHVRESRDVLRNRSEEHTSELQSRENLVCRLLLEKKK